MKFWDGIAELKRNAVQLTFLKTTVSCLTLAHSGARYVTLRSAIEPQSTVNSHEYYHAPCLEGQTQLNSLHELMLEVAA